VVFSTDGTCGAQHGRRRCAGKWGDCCHRNGTCGSGAGFCGTDLCQTGQCVNFGFNLTDPSAAYHSYGCYTEATTGRAIDTERLVDYTHMTVEMCATYCLTTHGRTIFGLEYGGECYCGNAPLAAGSVAAPANDCGMNCGGDAAKKCGGPNRLNLYGVSSTAPGGGSGNPDPDPNDPPPPTGFQSMGCYSEATQGRALNSGKCPRQSERWPPERPC
jgi:hypothetical protein